VACSIRNRGHGRDAAQTTVQQEKGDSRKAAVPIGFVPESEFYLLDTTKSTFATPLADTVTDFSQLFG